MTLSRTVLSERSLRKEFHVRRILSGSTEEPCNDAANVQNKLNWSLSEHLKAK